MKGRSVLLGDNLKDQHFNWAEFFELVSSPPTIESAKALDAMGRVKKRATPGGLYANVIARRRDVGSRARKSVAEALETSFGDPLCS